MNLYLVTYELKAVGQDYHDFYQALESLEDICQALPSVWFIYTHLDSTALYNYLCVSLDENDLFFITKVTKDSIGWLEDDVRLWLEDKI